MRGQKLFIFARFHVRSGSEKAALGALHGILGPSRQESGCLGIHAFRSVRDLQLFYIHSSWRDEAAFDHHANLPHTVRFVERMKSVVDQKIEVTRSVLLE